MSKSRSASAGSMLWMIMLGAALQAAPARPIVNVAPGIQLPLADGWSMAPQFYRNATELLRIAANRQRQTITSNDEKGQETGEWTPRLTILVEQNASHAASLKRLAGIALEKPAEPTYWVHTGWPALSRQVLEPLALRGRRKAPPREERERPSAGDPDSDRPERELSGWILTAAVAVDTRIVKVVARLPETAPPAELAEVTAMVRALTLPAGNARTAESELKSVRVEVQAVRAEAPPSPSSSSSPPHRALSSPHLLPPTGSGVFVQGGAETEMASTPSGIHVVIASQNNTRASHNGGQTYLNGAGMPFSNFGDPSLGWGQSDTFYLAGIEAFGTCAGATPSANGCHTGMSSSSNHGNSFTQVTDAVSCAATGANACFPDQEHIAVDRVNAGSSSTTDQIYVVWRNFTSSETPSLVCSSDSGSTWSSPVAVDTNGDWPRVSVGQDGEVYVVYASGPPGSIFLHKYSSCSSGLTSAGSPTTVAAYNGVDCATFAIPGLDRCNKRNTLASYTIAVDDTNASHLFLTYADNTATGDAPGGNENIVVRDSTDGGATWTGNVVLNSLVNGRRFMPWSCTINGTLYAGWYDGRNATAGSNDLARYFRSSASGSGASLTAGSEADVSGADDPLCASGWPAPTDATNNSEDCSTQPQLAGICLDSSNNPTGTNQRCDFSDGGCPSGFTCQVGRGAPKYGDYTGIACGGGYLFVSWASATPPAGLIGTSPAGIDTYTADSLEGAPPDLALTMTESPSPVLPLHPMTYTIMVSDKAGASLAQGVALSDALPTGTTFTSLTAAGWLCSTPTVGTNGTVTCVLASLAAGSSAPTLTLVINAPSSIGSVTNTATVSSNTTDANIADNSMTITTPVRSPSNVTATKVLTSSGPYVQYAPVVYTITLSNSGPGAQFDNPGDEFDDTIPTSLTVFSVTATSGVIATAGNSISWNGSIPAGGTVTITVRAQVTFNTLETITNQGTVHYDVTGVGSNTATHLTDDPSLPGSADPTSFATAPITEVPTLDNTAAVVLMILVVSGGIVMMRRRRLFGRRRG